MLLCVGCLFGIIEQMMAVGHPRLVRGTPKEINGQRKVQNRKREARVSHVKGSLACKTPKASQLSAHKSLWQFNSCTIESCFLK